MRLSIADDGISGEKSVSLRGNLRPINDPIMMSIRYCPCYGYNNVVWNKDKTLEFTIPIIFTSISHKYDQAFAPRKQSY